MTTGFQVMSGPSKATYGVYYADTPESALDQWAAGHGWGTWKEAQARGRDLFKDGFRVEEGFRILIV